MITTTTLNPAVDLNLEIDSLSLNRYNKIVKATRVPGGKGINVSKAIRAYGMETMAIGFVGGHNGHFIGDELRKNGITTNFWHIRRETRSNVIIIDKSTESHTLLSDPGPSISERDITRFKSIFSRVMAQTEVAVLSGRLPKDVPDNIYYDLINMAKNNNIKTILDASGIPFEEGLKAGPLMAKPDLRASNNMVFQQKVTSQEMAVKVAHEIIARGAEIAVISFQNTKDIVATRDQVWLAECITSDVINIIGTAEALIAGFAIKLAEGEPEMSEMIQFAMACGMASARTEDLEFHSKDDISKCLSCVKARRLR